MSKFSTPAILLRRMDYGDFDIIITFFTLKKGKMSLIAKSAKKSTKRFAGILELFSVLDVVASRGRGRGMPVLQEAVLKQPFGSIRADFKKTAFASYWAELIYNWMEENYPQVELFSLFEHVLSELDCGTGSEEAISVLFQMRFLSLSGHRPHLSDCSMCHRHLADIRQTNVVLDLKIGGIVCENCRGRSASRVSLSRGTIKQLLWVDSGDLGKAARIRFSPSALKEITQFLEAFICFHLGKEPRSLKFLRQIRGSLNS
ncbi:MAG: DNA repair protein RecO [Desulfobacterales bacterium]|nr:DNA repair protein RecO [Desulfobacterales bacterium]